MPILFQYIQFDGGEGLPSHWQPDWQPDWQRMKPGWFNDQPTTVCHYITWIWINFARTNEWRKLLFITEAITALSTRGHVTAFNKTVEKKKRDAKPLRCSQNSTVNSWLTCMWHAVQRGNKPTRVTSWRYQLHVAQLYVLSRSQQRGVNGL